MVAASSMAEITEALAKEFGSEAEVAFKPFSESFEPDNKLLIRVALENWSGQDHLLGSGQPSTGRQTAHVAVAASWRLWDYDSIRPENRRVIRVLERLGWQHQGVTHSADDRNLDSMLTFTSLKTGRY